MTSCSTLIIVTLFGFLFYDLSVATVYVQESSSFPANITASCSSALTADIPDCSSSITALRPSLYYPDTTLESLCTASCNAALNIYESSVGGACAGETFDSGLSGYVPLSSVPQLLRYLFNYTCLADSGSGEYCNVVAAEAIGILADQSNLNSENITGGGNFTCSDCDLKSLQFLAGAAYFHNDDTVSAYSSLTSSCHATGYPLTASTLSFTARVQSTFLCSGLLLTKDSSPTTTTPTITPTCTGSLYTIKAGDTCQSISKTQGVGTNWLITDNDLAAYCSNFPTSGTLCIEHLCSTYTVQANDTCTSITKSHNMTYAQILAWNPVFDLTCSNLNSSVGLEICVSSPGGTYIAPSGTIAPLTTATTATAVPTNAASGTNTDCGAWYEAQSGDYCNLLVLRFGISLADFLILNPEVNLNCTNLYALESYCIMPVGDISNYPGAFGYVPPVPSYTTIPFTSLPTATYIPDLYVNPGANISIANGTRTDCGSYIDGSDYQVDVTNTTFANNCQLAAAVYGITLDYLVLWNPSLGNASDTSCSFELNTRYCVAWSALSPSTSGLAPLPTASGVVSGCTQYTYAGDGVACSDIISLWNITLAYFYALNPSVGSDCSGFQLDTYYCASTNATVTLTTSSSTPTTTTSTISPPGPTQTGIISTCNAYYLTPSSGASCAAIEALYNISFATFYAWNPAVGSNCQTLFADEAYCVGVSSSPPTTTTTRSTSTSSTNTVVAPPGPTQSGIISTCNAYYITPNTGASCAAIESLYSISFATFYDWNPAVGPNCQSLYADEAYCVGVSSSPTTTSKSTTTKTASVTPPGPTQSGIISTCNAYYVTPSTGASCSAIEQLYDITFATFYAWNPAVGSNCQTLFADEAYCVGVSG